VVEGVGVATGDAPEARRRAEADAGVGPVSITLDAEGDVGHAGAASALASVVKACLALDRRILPAPRGPQFWLHDRDDGPRRAAVSAASVDGNYARIILSEYEPATLETTPDRRQPLGALSEALFALDGDTLAELLRGLGQLRDQIDGSSLGALARRWWHEHRPDPARRLGLALVTGSPDELRAQIDFAADRLRSSPDEPINDREHTGPVAVLRDRVFYAPRPLGPAGEVAFVYPGSGNHFPGMGRQLGVVWPETLRRQQAESRRLRSQFAPELFWDGDRSTPIDPCAALFGQVSLGGLVGDLLAAFGVRPAAAIGYSLGESAALFGLRAWRDRDGMLARLGASSLFRTDLAGLCDAARAAWGLGDDEPADWLAGVLARPAAAVRAALPHFPRTYLLIVNTPEECVIGGQRPAVEALARHLGGRFHPLGGVTIAHCDIVRQVAPAYRELHRLPTTPPAGVRFYSGATGRAYVPDTECAADAILGHALATLDFPRLIEAAYADGVRLFVEVGPGSSCSRMVASILGDRPHLARSACVRQQDEASTVLRLLGHLHAERVPVDLAALYGEPMPTLTAPAAEGPAVVVPVGRLPFRAGAGRPASPACALAPATPGSEDSTRGYPPTTPPGFRKGSSPAGAAEGSPGWSLRNPGSQGQSTEPGVAGAGAESLAGPDTPAIIPAFATARVAAAQAHETFLRFTAATHQHLANSFAFQTALLERLVRAPASPSSPGGETKTVLEPAQHSTPFLDRAGCLAFAVGQVGPVLGPAFAPIDAFSTRVRLPDEPLMLVDRITEIEGEPLSLTAGRLVTEHDIDESRWYLDNGRIPPSIAIESGQADLFLAGYLGIDFKTRGRAVYRLLDAAVTFHRGLLGPGATVRYDIRIERFFRQGDTYLFRFRFDGTVDGEPLLTMRDGCAGFFTAEELAAGKGVVLTELERRPQPGTLPPDWRPLAPLDGVMAYDARQLDALRRGDLAGCFGPAFAGLPVREPLTLPGADKLRLIHRVPHLDPRGGRYGLGLVRGEADIHADDWFLVCHFVDDQVMPGTLMYECCLHTLRVFLLRLGWVGEAADCTFEPVPGVASRLRCRGQVTAATRTVAYEIAVKELGYRPEPYAIADALMYADGKPIVDVRNITLRLTGATRGQMEALWGTPALAPRRESVFLPSPPLRGRGG
jgi:3-hydroxymyristoyl/3-hydroxydecanoyl-(acyl carrier protein) dehydratase